MRIPIIISIVVVVFRGRIGLGALPNVLSALLEMLSLSTRSSSPSAAASHFRTLRAAAAMLFLNCPKMEERLQIRFLRRVILFRFMCGHEFFGSNVREKLL